jgi:hypothetical protein
VTSHRDSPTCDIVWWQTINMVCWYATAKAPKRWYGMGVGRLQPILSGIAERAMSSPIWESRSLVSRENLYLMIWQSSAQLIRECMFYAHLVATETRTYY